MSGTPRVYLLSRGRLEIEVTVSQLRLPGFESWPCHRGQLYFPKMATKISPILHIPPHQVAESISPPLESG